MIFGSISWQGKSSPVDRESRIFSARAEGEVKSWLTGIGAPLGPEMEVSVSPLPPRTCGE